VSASSNPNPTVRPPGCAAIAWGSADRSYGFCPVLGHRVYLKATDRCLCDHCKPGPGGTRTLDDDAYFVGNDIVTLKSERAARLAAEHARAATMQCAPRTPKQAEPRAPSKPAPRPASKRKPGLLAFT